MSSGAGNGDNPRAAMVARGVSKSFGNVAALQSFDFDLRAGEVHALVGGNGSGKSTFIKILAGVYKADAGSLILPSGPQDLTSHSPAAARDAGLRFVHQDLGIFPSLSIAENLALGRGFERGRSGRIRWRQVRRAATGTLKRFHVNVDPSARASSLSMPQRALVAIARGLQDIEDDQGVLVLDEPTAALPRNEARLLLSSIRDLANRGHSVVLVTHRLDEVQRVADRVTGVRDGLPAGTINAEEITEDAVVELVLGRRLPKLAEVPAASREREPVLEVRGIEGGPIHGVDLVVRAGEVVGVAGLLGSGRTELLQLIYGALPAEAGDVSIGGKPVRHHTPGSAAALGMAFVPEDRSSEAMFLEHSIRENVTAGNLGPYFRGMWIRDRRLRSDVDDDLRRFVVKAGSSADAIGTLSGGNQQKVVLARWLRRDPKVILLDEPTQGIDVGAREEIFGLLARAVEQGAGVVLVSSEFEELARLCHRVVVLSEGRLVGEHQRGVTSHELLASVLEHARSVEA